ncbi:heterokaryon incompatibility protein-domain-containing protein [Xylariaceae sp. AK1471]|nr:heterokaryon incompatibility protein-domain-containing protein [Xylariaceae sp. AK1471]
MRWYRHLKKCCWTSHTKCAEERRERQSLRIPTRLIDVGQVDEANIKLQDTCTMNRVEYAALSYCWGDPDKNFTTTTESKASRQNGILIANLPKTIQDAIRVTRCMGIPYLWVDSICIVQDDIQELGNELRKMADIYARAEIVISAAVAKSCCEGFLGCRTPSTLLEAIYEIPFYPSTNLGQEGFIYVAEGTLNNQYKREAIDERAWTHQEHLQAYCILRFGSIQTRGDCLETDETDGGSSCPNVLSDGHQPDPTVFDGRYRSGSSLLVEGGSLLELPRHFEDWRKFLSQHTLRTVGKPCDRLPAFAAIAENFAHKTGSLAGRYLAGLWENDFILELLWFKKTPQGHSHGHRSGPSWSWASLPGQIIYPPSLFPPTTTCSSQLVNCTIQQRIADFTYGAVEGGTLEISGPLHKLLRTDCSVINQEPTDLNCLILLFDSISWDDTSPIDLDVLFWLEIMHRLEEYMGLVLKKLPGGHFQRVGYYCCPDQVWDRLEANLSYMGNITIVIV